MFELHIVQGDILRHVQHGNESPPVLSLKGFSDTELKEGPGLLETVDLLEQIADNRVFILGLELFLPVNKKVLESIVSLLPVGDPVLLTKLTKLLVELLKEAPSLLLLIQFLFKFVIEGKLGFLFLKMLAVSVDFRDPFLERTPLLTKFLHHLSFL
jgi:hypothetical protein